MSRNWTNWAIGRIEADFNRSADTHLLHLRLPACPDISLYFKDESSHPTGSLKHRLARSLFLYGLCNGWIVEGAPVIEASSGSTAVSEAYFAQLLGLRFIAVVPASTSQAKIDAIAFYGGECEFVERADQMHDAATQLARDLGGHFMDQFTFAERATDWRGNNNIADSLFNQMAHEPHPDPAWIVCGAGTGGTSATIGRYIRYNCHKTQICLADPHQSIFHKHWNDRTVTKVDGPASCIEGIGRPGVEPSFIPELIDRAICVDDVQSLAATRVLSEALGKLCGGSTGTNFWAMALLSTEMARQGQVGSIVSILCDGGERYRDRFFDDQWINENASGIGPYEDALREFLNTGQLPESMAKE